MLFKLLILMIQLKKLTITQKIEKIEKRIPDQYKYISTQEFDKLTSEIFAERLKAKLATKMIMLIS